jgi:hypothetical protein
MSTIATLDAPNVSVEAGGEVSVPLRLRNDSSIVEEYRFQVVGQSSGWATVVPESVSLYPGHDITVSVEFRPPRSAAVLAGEYIFGVHVQPKEHPDGAAVPEGSIKVLPFFHLTGEVLPKTSRGRRGARHHIAIDNRGNAPVTVKLTGSDPAELLEISVQSPVLAIEPGTVQFSSVSLRPAQTIWRGMPATGVFNVVATPADGPPLLLDGSYAQQPVLPRGIAKVLLSLLLLAGAAGAAAAAWHLVLISVEKSEPNSPQRGPVLGPERGGEREVSGMNSWIGSLDGSPEIGFSSPALLDR